MFALSDPDEPASSSILLSSLLHTSAPEQGRKEHAMPTATQEIFDITASTYDADRAKLIPCFDAFYRRATDLIAHGAKNILDLGAGTGLLSQFVREWYPNAHIVLADLSEAMIEKARFRFSGDTNVTFEVTDYTTAPITGTYDSIVSPHRRRGEEGAVREDLRCAAAGWDVRECGAGCWADVGTG
jgi:predicted TPR repeat methyltransferase